MEEKKDSSAQALEHLKQEYVAMKESRIRPWRAWVGIGLLAGIFASFLLVANKKGEFEGSLAVRNQLSSVRVMLAGDTPTGDIVAGGVGQIIAKFEVDVTGDAVVADSIKFKIKIGIPTRKASGKLTTFVLFDELRGVVVAGPRDMESDFVVFGDPVMIPVGKNIYSVKTNIGANVGEGTAVRVSTTPSAHWDLTAQGSGKKIKASPGKSIVSPVLTVRVPTLSVSIANTPAPKNIIRGSNNVHFATIRYDATKSTEPVRVVRQELTVTTSSGADADDLNNCKIFDGTTPMVTGANAVNPVGNAPGDDPEVVFTFDSFLFVPKGQIRSVDVRCNISSGASVGGIWSIGIGDTDDDTFAVGSDTGISINEIVTVNKGPEMTVITNGTLGVTLDISTPSAKMVTARSTGVPVTVLRFSAVNEPIRLEHVGLQLDPGFVSNVLKLQVAQRVTLWDGANLVGETIPVPAGTSDLNFVLNQPTVIPKDGVKVLTVKVDIDEFKPQGVVEAADTITINYSGGAEGGAQRTYGLGQESGTRIYSSTAVNTIAASVVVFRSVPSVERLSIPTNTLTNGTNILYRAKITANSASAIGLGRVAFRIVAGAGEGVLNPKLYLYTDSAMSQLVGEPITLTGEVLGDGIYRVRTGSDSIIRIPEGRVYYFEFRADIDGVNTGSIVSVALLGDATWSGVKKLPGVETYVDNDFIWSGNSIGVSEAFDPDWANGYLVPGLPSTNLGEQTLSN